jgi:photosystem II stability/assembly factor-like uncharacterized protein
VNPDHPTPALFRFLMLACLCVTVPALLAQESPDIEYAESMPLAAHSLLLDVAALSGGGFVAVGERGHVVYSANGMNWQQASVVPTRATLTSVTEFQGRLWAAGHDSEILTSGDGGVTWTRQFHDPERQQPIMDIHFFSAQRGLAVGAYGLALVTGDGGQTWEEGTIGDEEWHYNAMLALSDGRIMVAGEAGYSYRSQDGGETWETLDLPYSGSMFGIVDGTENCILVFGLRGHVQESCDFGERWSELASGTESSISGAVHVHNTTVMVGNSGLVLTREGQAPLRAEYHSSGVDFAAIAASGDGRFILVGEDGVHHYPEAGRSEP